jgi:broad specificity phosphatase PhoE
MHLRWLAGVVRGAEGGPAATERARAAAQWVSGQHAGGTTLAVTHGVFRRLLARQLRTDGWRFADVRRGYGYWSVWRLVR